MNKFERGFLDNKNNPNHLLERIDSFTVPKVKRLLLEFESVSHPVLETKMERLIKKTEDKFRVLLSEKDLMRKALEDISLENGFLPEKLRAGFVTILADDIFKKTGKDGDIFSEIELELEYLRSKGLFVEESELRRKVLDLYYENQKK